MGFKQDRLWDFTRLEQRNEDTDNDKLHDLYSGFDVVQILKASGLICAEPLVGTREIPFRVFMGLPFWKEASGYMQTLLDRLDRVARN